jgi:hypothetical protein
MNIYLLLAENKGFVQPFPPALPDKKTKAGVRPRLLP